MRHNKFRGKRIDNGIWVYGDGVVWVGNDYCAIPQTKDVTSEDYQIVLCKVVLSTVGEFVDMTDKKDAPICAGDIVKCWDSGDGQEHIGIIEYTSPCFSLKIPGKLTYDGAAVKHWDNDIFLDHWCNAENIEVIGNIHDNPDLFKSLPQSTNRKNKNNER